MQPLLLFRPQFISLHILDFRVREIGGVASVCVNACVSCSLCEIWHIVKVKAKVKLTLASITVILHVCYDSSNQIPPNVVSTAKT